MAVKSCDFNEPLNDATARKAMDAAATSLTPYPGGFEGRGIVIPAGGMKYFPCAWVNLHMLRHVGCALPVELWHLGPGEMTDEMRSLVEPLGVTCVDALEVRRRHPVRTLNGWELKPYAILHSRFREVLMLDADNVPILNPETLFETPEYRRHGAVFWPDYGCLDSDRSVWRLAGVPFRDEPEFETGQVVVDKERCWGPLRLTMWMNEHSDFWYQHIHGDKETFHLAWRKLGRQYAMPRHPVKSLSGVMCQHDFAGRRIFQHRNTHKWSLGENERVNGFLLEEECLHSLDQLRKRSGPSDWLARSRSPQDREKIAELAGSRFRYVRVGYDVRAMCLDKGGVVSEGSAAREMFWWLEEGTVVIAGDDGSRTCLLAAAANGCWEGRWLQHEQMPVRLEPLGPEQPAVRVLELGCGMNPTAGALHHDRWRHSEFVDVAWDLDELPWPWEDESFDQILATDVVEHLKVDVDQWLNECWRILVPGGTLHLQVPDYRSESQWTDPTHRRAFTLRTFDFWDPDKELHQSYGRLYFGKANRWWNVLSAEPATPDDTNLRFVLMKA